MATSRATLGAMLVVTAWSSLQWLARPAAEDYAVLLSQRCPDATRCSPEQVFVYLLNENGATHTLGRQLRRIQLTVRPPGPAAHNPRHS